MFAAFVFILALKVEEKTKKMKILIHEVQHLVKKSFSQDKKMKGKKLQKKLKIFL